jgi:hypothetical protein
MEMESLGLDEDAINPYAARYNGDRDKWKVDPNFKLMRDVCPKADDDAMDVSSYSCLI